MKICFISGPYRPNKCGISDYIDLLEKEFIKRNHYCLKYWIETTNDLDIISKNLPKADLYSVQFGPFSFSSSGLSNKPLSNLARILSRKKTLINFHEIWVGDYPGASWRESILGWRQKKEVLKFLKILNPINIYTSNAAAIYRLRRQGINATYLYLYGNIPPSSKNEFVHDSEKINVIFFGTLYDSFPFNALGFKLNEISNLLSKKIILYVVGRQRKKEGLIKLRKMASTQNFNLVETKEQTTEEISRILTKGTIGVSTTPYDIIGKSGTTAAMLEHGLPILAFDDGDTPNDYLFIYKVFRNNVFLLNEECNTEKIAKTINRPKKTFFDGVSIVVDRMLRDIKLN